jgi:predicted TPR repeat methyltransferase
VRTLRRARTIMRSCAASIAPNLQTVNTSRLQAALAQHRSGRFGDAEAGYRDCIAAGETAAAAPLATLLLQQERFAEAAAVLEPLVEAAAENAGLRVNLSVALRRTGRHEEALRYAREACDLSPANAAACNALGLAALELQRTGEALQAFERGLALAPGHPALTLHRAHALRRSGRNREALVQYDAIVRGDPDSLEGWRGLAQTQAALGLLDAALRTREIVLARAGDDHEASLEHAVALLQAGHADRAAERFERVVERAPHDAQAWAWLGRARIKQGDLESARAAFAEASARDRDDPVIAHFRAALSGELPAVVEAQYIRNFFDNFADRFEQTLLGNLRYGLPQQLAARLERHPAGAATTVLDLGCGTGLMGERLARDGRVIDGVDLSARMLDHARAKNAYRELHAAEIGAFLEAATVAWELVLAADVFVYVADLRPVFAAAFARLAPGGWFAFSIERSAGAATELVPATGRYRHSSQQAIRDLEACGFANVASEPIVVRFENGEPVAGALILAQRPRD